MVRIIIRGDRTMEKKWYQSLTIKAAIGYAIVQLLEGLTPLNPEYATYAKTLAALLTAFGIRRAMR